MKARILSLLVAALALVPATDLASQEMERYVGSRVRLTVRSPFGEAERLVGKLAAVEGDTLRLRTKKDGTTQTVSLGLIERFQVALGRKPERGKGAVIGILVGGALGAVAGFVAAEDCSDEVANSSFICVPRATVAGGLAVVGAATGGVLGYVLGKSTRWKEVPLTGVRVGIGPQRGGTGFSVSASVHF